MIDMNYLKKGKTQWTGRARMQRRVFNQRTRLCIYIQNEE